MYIFVFIQYSPVGFPGYSGSKNSACSSGDLDLIPELGRSPGEGHGNPLQYSCLENAMDRGRVRGGGHKQSTRLSNEHFHTFIIALKRNIFPKALFFLSNFLVILYKLVLTLCLWVYYLKPQEGGLGLHIKLFSTVACVYKPWSLKVLKDEGSCFPISYFKIFPSKHLIQ